MESSSQWAAMYGAQVVKAKMSIDDWAECQG